MSRHTPNPPHASQLLGLIYQSLNYRLVHYKDIIVLIDAVECTMTNAIGAIQTLLQEKNTL
jgi:hypothetical protein